jgi:YgiT-type zinc finger domain-containing protein
MAYACPACSMGQLKATGTPYMQVTNGTLIQVPTITAWKCDICGESFFDERAVRRLDTLIGEAGPPPNRHRSTPPHRTPTDSVGAEPAPEDVTADSVLPDDRPDALRPSSE